MSSEFDDIAKDLRGYRNDLDQAITFLSSENPRLGKERIATNKHFASQDRIMKEIFYHLEKPFRIAEGHRLQMIELYQSIMSLPEAKADRQLQQNIKDRFEAVKDKQS